MKPRTLWTCVLPPARLDALLGQALDCARRRHQDDVAECIVCAMEAHAEATGDDVALDAAYLRVAKRAGLASGIASSDTGSLCAAPFLRRAGHRAGRVN